MDSNYVIRRTIVREGSKSQFSINGERATNKAVVELAQNLSIQIDNLCQFLPQDRVVEFAALSPVDLLRETQRAAAPAHMIKWHERLKALGYEQKKMEADRAQEQGHLKTLEARQNAQKDDVDRMKQRQELVLKSRVLKHCRNVVQCRVLKESVKEAKAARTKTERRLQRLETELEPALRAINAKEAYRASIEHVVKRRERDARDANATAQGELDAHAAAQARVNKAKSAETAEKEQARKWRSQRLDLESEIAEIRRKKEADAPDFDVAFYNQKIAELTREAREISQSVEAVKDKQIRDINQKNEWVRKSKSKSNELESLVSREGMKMQRLRDLSEDAVRVRLWLQEPGNRDKFEGEIYDPPVISCSVKHPRLAGAVETRLMPNDLMAFTCTTENDFKMLQSHVQDTMKLHYVAVRYVTKSLDYFRRPSRLPTEYGLRCWLLDFLQGPEPVLAMLCDSRALHAVAFGDRTLSFEQHAKLESPESPITSWIVDGTLYSVVRRREYGNAKNTQSNELRKPKWFCDPPVDEAKRHELMTDLADMQRKVDEYNTLHAEHCNTLHRLQQEFNEKGAEKVRLSSLSGRT